MKAEALRCPSCKANIELRLNETKTSVCQACGAVFDCKTLKVLEQLKLKDFPPKSFLKLGLIGNIYGKDYQIVGRISYSSRVFEFDQEDQRFYSTDWPYDSWLLLSEDGSYAYISEDKEAYYFEESITPEIPGFPDSKKFGPGLFAAHGKVLAEETSYSQIAFFEGEFSWQPKVGQKSETAEYSQGGFSFQASKTIGENDEVKEIEFFRGREISELALAEGFQDEATLKKIFSKLKKDKEYKLFGNLAIVAALGLGIFGFIINVISPGSHVKHYSSLVTELNSDGKLFGPIILENKDRVHKIKFSVQNMPTRSSFIAGIELLDSNKKVVNEIGSNFWVGSGYDGDRHLEEDRSFRLSKAGSYAFRMFAEDVKPTNHGAYKSQRTTFSMQIYQNVMPTQPYFVAAFLILLYGISIRYFKVTNPLYLLFGGLLVLFLIVKFLEKLKSMEED